MSIRHYLKNSGGTFDEVTSRVQRISWQAGEKAEEGAAGMWTVTLADPGMDLDVLGWMTYVVEEDSSALADNVVAAGFTGAQEIHRGDGTDAAEVTGRVWDVEVADINTVWGMRLFTAAASNRPAETDVARMQWALGTAQAALFDDVATFVSTASPVAMDKFDYRGQTLAQVANDCALASGKNWYAWLRRTDPSTRKVTAWYGTLDSATLNVSALSLSNDPADWTEAALAAGTSLVWPHTTQSKLRRDPGRVGDAVYETYPGGALYKRRAATSAAFGGLRRDLVAPLKTVTTLATATADAAAFLAGVAKQDERITTSVLLPAAVATGLRIGMAVPFKATHLPGFSAFRTTRVVECQPRPAGAGDRYDIGLTLVPMGFAACQMLGVTVLPDGFYPPLLATAPTSRADGLVRYSIPGMAGDPPPQYPVPFYAGSWHFPQYNSGGSDFAGDHVLNFLYIYTTGPGTMTVHTTAYPGTADVLRATLSIWNTSTGSYSTVISAQSGITPGADVVITVPDDGACYHIVAVTDTSGSGSKWGWSGYNWVNA